MKKILYLFSLLALTSCAASFQQIASISSPQMRLTDDGHFAYSEEDIVVDYNFWAPSGQMNFIITNNLDSDVYVDLGRSFLVVNGMTFDYFQNRTYSFNSSDTILSGSGCETSNTFAAGVATSRSDNPNGDAYGAGGGFSSSKTFSRGTGKSSTVNRGVEYKEKEGVWIPAHSSRRFCEFTLMDVPYRQCGFARNPSRNEDMTLSFTEKNSPYAFDNVLMLVVNGIDRRIVNSFYVSSLTNIQSDETYEDKHVENCDGSKSSEIVRIYKHLSANRFFINYDYNSQHDRDTDDDRTQRKLSPFLGL